MGSRGPRRRKPRVAQPPPRRYLPMPAGGRRYWRLGGPLTADHEAEALAARAARPQGRVGRFVLRVLGYRPPGR